MQKNSYPMSVGKDPENQKLTGFYNNTDDENPIKFTLEVKYRIVAFKKGLKSVKFPRCKKKLKLKERRDI